MSVVLVIPSRGRPEAAASVVMAARGLATRVDTSIVLVVDADDPTLGEYRVPPSGRYGAECSLVVLDPADTGSLVRATNTVSRRIADADGSAIIGNIGDDHYPRTAGWDSAIAAALGRPGFAYGDDLIHGERLPSAPFISASIVAALGWYFLPALEHLYCDDAVRELGSAADALTYLPDVVIEHMHPAVGKGTWDAGYERANAQSAMLRDRAAYEAWRASAAFDEAVATVRALRS